MCRRVRWVLVCTYQYFYDLLYGRFCFAVLATRTARAIKTDRMHTPHTPPSRRLLRVTLLPRPDLWVQPHWGLFCGNKCITPVAPPNYSVMQSAFVQRFNDSTVRERERERKRDEQSSYDRRTIVGWSLTLRLGIQKALHFLPHSQGSKNSPTQQQQHPVGPFKIVNGNENTPNM